MDFIVFFFGTLSVLVHATLACLGALCGLVLFLTFIAACVSEMVLAPTRT